MMKFVEIKMKEYCSSTKTIRDIYIYNYNRELCFSLEQTREEINLVKLLEDILKDDEKIYDEIIIKKFTAIHYPPGHKDEYIHEFFIFNLKEKQLKHLNPSKDIKINLPLQIPEEVEISVWHEDYRDWGGKFQTKAYLREKLEDTIGIKLAFYRKKDDSYEYWTSPAQGEKLGELYQKGVLQDLLKILGVKKLTIKEHNRIYYHPTSSRLFGLKDQAWDNEYEISLIKRDLKNKYIIFQNDKLEIYVELEA